MNEFSLIAKYFAPLAAPETDCLTNDGTRIPVPDGKTLVVTSDTLIEGVHFLTGTSPVRIAQKALRTNLSDLAAMGAVPHRYNLSLTLPKNTEEAWFADFSKGLATDQDVYGVLLSGGDTTAYDGILVISITMHGLVDAPPLTRSGAQVSDTVFITGTIGDATLGLTRQDNAYLRDRYELPQPRIAVGEKLHGIATACLDISDGLVQDAGHITQCSNVGMTLHAKNIAMSAEALALLETDSDLLHTIINGGDDYELLFTAPASQADAIATIAKETSITITPIGEVVKGDGVSLYDESGSTIPIASAGYSHF